MKIATRAVSEDDRKKNRFFEHMAGLTGVVQNVYEGNEVAIKIDVESLSKVTAGVHKESGNRMREKFNASLGEEQKKQLTKEELDFVPNYVLLVASADLEKN